MPEGNRERQEQESTDPQEEQTKQPAREAPEEDVGTPPPPDEGEIREGVEEGTEEAFKSEEEED
jgi:hypothetical protein